jgi:hypothetical protein
MDIVGENNSNINNLIENARNEIRKSRPQNTDREKQTEAKNILDHSVSFADNVLKRLVAHTVDEDIKDLFDECVDTRGAILIKSVDNKSNDYTLNLDIVDCDYMLDLKHFTENKEVRERIIFLLNTVKVLYCPIKDYMKKWGDENNIEFNYVLQIGLNTTLFLDKDSKKRIGIILTPVDNKKN